MDIHSHILPRVDDGSSSAEESIELLNMLKAQGVTDVVATPHFDASANNIDDFKAAVSASAKVLKDAAAGLELPEILLGSEVYYFPGIGKSVGVRELCIEDSRYLLLELRNADIDKVVLKDIKNMVYELGIIPIFAHIERYYHERGFKNLLKVIASGDGYAQINAQSLLTAPYKRIANKLIKNGYISFIASDTHSVKGRPPLIKEALLEVKAGFGQQYADVFKSNSDYLYNEICGK